MVLKCSSAPLTTNMRDLDATSSAVVLRPIAAIATAIPAIAAAHLVDVICTFFWVMKKWQASDDEIKKEEER